jgi:hypothetical protein
VVGRLYTTLPAQQPFDTTQRRDYGPDQRNYRGSRHPPGQASLSGRPDWLMCGISPPRLLCPSRCLCRKAEQAPVSPLGFRLLPLNAVACSVCNAMVALRTGGSELHVLGDHERSRGARVSRFPLLHRSGVILVDPLTISVQLAESHGSPRVPLHRCLFPPAGGP